MDYLGLRLWIGIWIGVILLILVAVDASAFVCYITRFTEENFALLIATIFIYKVNPIYNRILYPNLNFFKQKILKAIEKVISIGTKNPMNPPIINDCFCMPSNDTIYAGEKFNWTEVPWQDCQSVYTLSFYIFLCPSTLFFKRNYLFSVTLGLQRHSDRQRLLLDENTLETQWYFVNTKKALRNINI